MSPGAGARSRASRAQCLAGSSTGWPAHASAARFAGPAGSGPAPEAEQLGAPGGAELGHALLQLR